MFKHKKCRRTTWISPEGNTVAQTDYTINKRTMKSKMRNYRTYNSADIGSDHSLLMAELMVKVRKRHRRKATRKFDVEKLLVNQEIAREFEVSKGGRFQPLLVIDGGTTDAVYQAF